MPREYMQSPNANYAIPDADAVRPIIGARIRDLRLKLRMSQKELAQNLGKESATYIALIEQGKRNISAAELARLARHLKVELSYFHP